MRAAALAVFCAAAVAGQREHASANDLNSAVPESAKAESEWLTLPALKRLLSDIGYESEEQHGRLVVTLTPEAPKRIYAEFSDQDSIKLLASWNSPQKDLGDGPIVNTWNNERRFCKVSINENPEDKTQTLMVMHMDQLLYTQAGEAASMPTVKYLLRKSMDTFKAGVLEFDKFTRDTYRNWQKQWVAEGKEL
eukprot:TRINITY_DN6995_c0_g1_i1.p1 TRINITY_DN6995_c0_g1~~TRINITY_DN6995_c0_g1_i1.p1  ORF type:complete len:216 (+),score=104.04 TRINITY_DN6995_c0_g1_i1:71-649(+)